MKRAPKTKLAVVPPLQPVRQCSIPGCGNILRTHQKKFCSIECKGKFLRSGNGGGRHEGYKPEFSTTVLKAYFDWIKKEHEPTLIPTESSYLVLPNAEIPSKDGYAEYLEENGHIESVTVDTLDNWGVKHPEFAHALTRITRVQKNFLFSKGASGRYNSAIAKLGLNVNHGMVERSQIDNTHKLIGVVKHVYERANEIEKQLYGGDK